MKIASIYPLIDMIGLRQFKKCKDSGLIINSKDIKTITDDFIIFKIEDLFNYKKTYELSEGFNFPFKKISEYILYLKKLVPEINKDNLFPKVILTKTEVKIERIVGFKELEVIDNEYKTMLSIIKKDLNSRITKMLNDELVVGIQSISEDNFLFNTKTNEIKFIDFKYMYLIEDNDTKINFLADISGHDFVR